MINVTVRYYIMFFIAAGNLTEEQIALPDGSTLLDLLETIAAKHKDMAGKLWEKDKLSPIARVIVNNILPPEDPPLDLVLKDGDRVVLTTPLIVGG